MSLKSLLTPGWIEPITKRAWRHLVAEQETVAIPLARARLCVQCDMIHQADTCPRCQTTASVQIRKVFIRLERALKNKQTKMKVKRPAAPAIPAATVARIENGRKKYGRSATS